jgi:Kef-type K+ transport system membrane component KefB
VIDDVIGLVILSVVGGIVSGASLSFLGIAGTTSIALGFIAVALILGSLVVPPVFRFIDRLEASGTLGVAGLAFAFLLAWLASLAGSATIIGAFAAGILLHNTPQRARIERSTTTLGLFFVPIFFAVVGAEVALGAFSDMKVLAVGSALLAVALVGKVAAGYAPFWFKGRKLLIGVAMIPRGEVGLIFATMGLTTGVLTSALFSAVTMMVLATTLLTPTLLAYMIRLEPHAPDDADRPGAGGIDDLVSGTAETKAILPLDAAAGSGGTSTSP